MPGVPPLNHPFCLDCMEKRLTSTDKMSDERSSSSGGKDGKRDVKRMLKEDLTISEFKAKYPNKKRSYRKEHRCNRRLEDVLDAFGFSTWSEVRYRFGLFRKCIASNVGEEPNEPYGIRREGESE